MPIQKPELKEDGKNSVSMDNVYFDIAVIISQNVTILRLQSELAPLTRVIKNLFCSIGGAYNNARTVL